MPEVVIIAQDGTEHVFPDGFNPKKAALIVRGAPSNSVIPEQSGAKLPFGLDTFLNQAESTNEDPGGTLAMLASTAAVGPAISAVGKVAPVVARAAASPVGQGVIGAAMGGYTGGVPGAIAGGMAGATGGYLGRSKVLELLNRMGLGKADVVAKGMSAAGQAAITHADDLPPALRALMNGGNADDLAAAVSKPVAKAAVPATRQALENEIGKRIDWRVTDAVPIDAIKRDVSRGGSIIEAGESQVGLAERLAQLLKTPTPVAMQEATELAKALRQRGHITRGMK